MENVEPQLTWYHTKIRTNILHIPFFHRSVEPYACHQFIKNEQFSNESTAALSIQHEFKINSTVLKSWEWKHMVHYGAFNIYSDFKWTDGECVLVKQNFEVQGQAMRLKCL